MYLKSNIIDCSCDNGRRWRISCFGISGNSIWMCFLLGMVAAAVFCLLHMECENHIWNILKKNALKQSMVYLEWYEKKKDSYEPIFIRGTAVGVVLYTGSDSDNYCRAMETPDYCWYSSVGLLLFILAIGVNLLVRVGMVKAVTIPFFRKANIQKKKNCLRKKTDTFFWVYIGA